jgi:hypothetical protein
MKNIHVLPTPNTSRIISSNKEFTLLKNYTTDKRCKNIYITSDEEIKEGDWCIDEKENIVKADKDFIFNCSHEFNEFWKKIILTTDQDLIKDGVQAIDDEFLEWFVKNPSCEEVDVKNPLIANVSDFGYKIIIPKEEPKQELRGIPAGTINMVIGKPKQETLEQIDQNNLVTRGSTALVYKQETIEEAAERLFPDSSIQKRIFKMGAKYQAERSYSEEEVETLLETLSKVLVYQGNEYRLPHYFEYEIEQVIKQFKKK